MRTVQIMTLPMSAMLSLAGAALGIYLGNSAIAEINPAYFTSPERGTSFHSDLAGYRSPASASGEQATLIDAASNEPLYHGCIGCRSYPEEYLPVHEASLGKVHAGWASTSYEVPAEPAGDAMTPQRARSLSDIERYARYPITAEEETDASEEGEELALASEISAEDQGGAY